jgi:hypothetical protein
MGVVSESYLALFGYLGILTALSEAFGEVMQIGSIEIKLACCG